MDDSAYSPVTSIARAVVLSAALHAVAGAYGGFSPHVRPDFGSTPLNVSFMPVRHEAQLANPPSQVRQAPVPARRAMRRPEEIPAAAIEGNVAETGAPLSRQAPREAAELPLAQFDPAQYLPPSEVEVVALPINEDLFDMLPLTGNDSGYWLVRLFIDQEGKVDELQVVENRGNARNTEELRSVLLANRFQPAIRDDGPVKSQKLLEFSFEPGEQPRLSTPVQVLSATEK